MRKRAYIVHRAGLGDTQTVSRFRPFALLLLRTFMPPVELILALKPWVRARLMLLG
jgi:hypothetical protein